MAQPAESRHQTKRTAGGKRLRLGAKLRNASFVALLLGALVVCDTVALTTLAQPQESPSRYIVLENRTSAQPVALSARAIVSGSFQTSLEESISDALPFKSEAALESAALQRAFIDASARLFGFSIHPTYYGSQHAYSADQDAVIPFPTLVTDELAATLAKGAQAMGSAAAANPTLGVFYYAPPHLADLASNPLISYTPPHRPSETPYQIIQTHLSPDIITIGSSSEPTFESGELFRAEHHWTIQGAYEAYVRILSAMSPTAHPVVPESIVSYDAPFYGSFSRLGLCKTRRPDAVQDIQYPEANLRVVVDGQEASIEDLRHRALYDAREWSADPFTLRYEEYFHWNKGLIEIVNDDAESDRVLLIVGDSYTNPLERLFAENYRTVYCIDPRYYTTPLSDFLDTHQVDDLLFLLCPATLELPNVQEYIGG